MTSRTFPADLGNNQEPRRFFDLFLLVFQVRKWLSAPKAKPLSVIATQFYFNFAQYMIQKQSSIKLS